MANFTRRNFLQHSALLALFMPSLAARAQDTHLTNSLVLVNQWRMPPDDWVPNNAALPVLHLRMHEGATESRETLMNDLIKAGWSSQWLASPYGYQHFHSRTHAIFIVESGEGEVRVGGGRGQIIPASVGDVIFLPAGTGQQLLKGSSDFAVSACYPKGNSWDVCRSAVNTHTLEKAANKTINNRTRQIFNTAGAVI